MKGDAAMRPSGNPYSESDLNHGGARSLYEGDKCSEKKQSIDDEYRKNHLTGERLKKRGKLTNQSFFSV